MSVQEMDRNYLWERCNILNAFLDEIIDYEEAEEALERLDFKFEALVGLEMIPVLEPAKPFNWEDE